MADPKKEDGTAAVDAAALAAAEKKGRDEASAETATAVAAERKRVADIMAAGKGKAPEAVQALVEQGVSAEAATAVLGAMPDAAAPAASGGVLGLAAGMNAHGSPRVAPNAGSAPDEDQEAAAASSAYLAGADAALKEMI